ncbi:MAG: aldehyde dehydrogenase [Thermoprotei archaeon]|nr:MAG: aldehyde dehydrogenase [Thermoprotei archaeon]
MKNTQETEGNVHEVIKEYMTRARKAQQVADTYSQEKVDELVTAMAWVIVSNAEEIAQLTQEETGLGRLDHKIVKLQKKVRGCLRDIKHEKTRGIVEVNPKTGITKIAKPVGVVGAITPVTNPEATPVIKSMFAIKGGNAVIVAPHPRGKKCASKICEYMRQTIEKLGAPADLIQCIPEPTVELSKELMRQCDLIAATGGEAMVHSAYSSGKPAYGVGVGNACVIVDETADIKDAAHKIMLGKTFDWATSCSAENSIIVEESIYNKLLEALQSEGGYLANKEEKSALQKTMWTAPKMLNRAIIAQPATKIAEIAGFTIPEDRTFLMVEEQGVGVDYPFSGEKLSVVLTVYKYKGFDNAIALVNKLTGYMGLGHSCGIHSFDDERIDKLALQTKTGRVIVRQPQSYANSGDWCNGMPFSLSIGCGTWGNNASSENTQMKHFLNVTLVARPIEPVIPTDEELFGDYWAKYGK